LKESEKYLIQVTKEQVAWLIKNGYLKGFKGKYQGLTICSRKKGARRKNRYISDDVAKFLPKVENIK